MIYQVMQQFGKSTPKKLGDFNDIPTARKYIHEKLASDALYKLNAVYQITQYDEIFEEWTQEKWQKIASSSSGQESSNPAASGGAGAQSTSGFRPSPLQTSPRPGGVPASSFKDEDQGKDKK